MKELYNQAFAKAFSTDAAPENLSVNSISAWDSVGHMMLIGEIEDAFDIMLDTEDIIGFVSYEKGMEILKKYDITV